MPKIVDHDLRRMEVAEAVWRIVEADGYEGLTMRRIADESSWSLGAVVHYFPNKDALLLFAYELMASRARESLNEAGGRYTGVKALAAAAEAAVSPTNESGSSTLIWLAFLPRAASREDFRAVQATAQANWRSDLIAFIRSAAEELEVASEIDADMEAELLASFIDGLSLQAVFEPQALPAARQRRLLRSYLRGRGLARV
jgi:AcrR family transcriptional regulator